MTVTNNPPPRQPSHGQLFEAPVKDVASDGRGVVSHPSGMTFFVPGVWVGEYIRARVIQVKGRVGTAECIELIEKSVDRSTPPCPHHGVSAGQCGGCPWMFMAYEAQVAQKQQRVEQSFRKLGCEDIVRPIWASERALAYRNRAQFKTDGKQIGFVSASSNQLAPITQCEILSGANKATLEALQSQLPNLTWKPKRKNQLTTLDIDESIDAEGVSVNQRLPFQQANAAQNEKLKQWLRDKLAQTNKTTALELFCGSGNLTSEIVNAGFEKIFAVEVVDDAIAALKDKGFANVVPLAENLFTDKGLEKVVFQSREAEVLVLDPPRDGLKAKAPLLPKKSKIRDVLYVSCDLATLVRDVEYFQQNKFKVKEIQPLDMFPQTPHVETLVWLQR